jgi:hypothetical protein
LLSLRLFEMSIKILTCILLLYCGENIISLSRVNNSTVSIFIASNTVCGHRRHEL